MIPFDNVDFINSKPIRGFKMDRLFQMINVVTKYIPDRLFGHPNIFGYAHECAFYALLFNIG
jgi:hypothetical protein